MGSDSGSSDDSSPKQLELLTTIVPNVSRIGLPGKSRHRDLFLCPEQCARRRPEGWPFSRTDRGAQLAGNRGCLPSRARMIIIETFARGCQPTHRPTPALAGIRIDTS